MTATIHPKAGRQAVVLGGSIAGLFAARVLADHFEQVTLIERDRIFGNGSSHQGVSQARHVHILLLKGLTIARELFPDLIEGLQRQGAVELDFGADVRWYQLGNYNRQFCSGVRVWSQSRPLLEAQLRQRVARLQNITILSEHAATGLSTTPDGRTITGVHFRPQGTGGTVQVLSADLVVDAMGRGSLALQWLEKLGYDKPKTSEVTVEVSYTSRIYARKPEDLGGMKGLLLSPTRPHQKRGGVIAPIEGDRWLVTLMGYLGDRAPTDEQGFLAFARSLPTTEIYDLIAQAQPLSSPIPQRFPSSLRRHYECLARFPQGFLVLGDALCSFNPIFGQGMTVAALEAQILDRCLQTSDGLTNLAKRFFKQAAAAIDTSWQMAICEDFRYPEVIGERSLGTAAMNWYIRKIYEAAHHDTIVYDAFIQVMHLVRSPRILFHPLMMRRVLKSAQ